MKSIYLLSFIIIFAAFNLFAQENLEENIDMAYQNAKNNNEE